MADIDFFKRLVIHPGVVIKDLYYHQRYIQYKKYQWDSLENNIKRQDEELYRTVLYSVRNIPYYKNLFKNNNLRISKNNIRKEILKFPILTKDIIRENFSDLLNKRLVYKSQKNSSGGTTGEPVTFYQQKENIRITNIYTLMQHEWTGYRLGEMFVQIWGNEDEIFKYGKSATGIIKFSDNHYLLNSFRMSDGAIKRYIEFINSNRPALILAYVQSITDLAQFIISNKLTVHAPKAIITTAGTLSLGDRTLIEKAFGARVFNRYGSREVHNVACECEMHDGLHLDTFFHYVEILDDQLNPVTKEGEKGRIYITLFKNPVMPLIRYEIGDVATFTKKRCICGRGLPLIGKVNGRTVDIFINANKEKIDGEYFTHLFYMKSSIKKFQVVQLNKREIIVKYIKNNKASKNLLDRDLGEIDQKIKLVMGADYKIRFQERKHINNGASGKYRYTISKILK